MFKLEGNLKFININQEYLKELHDICSEVFYKPSNYDTKPYLVILINLENQQYVIPLSSAKEKHKDGTCKHILSAIDLKKMIPIKEGLYIVINFNPNTEDSDELKKYKILLNLEYSFWLKIIPKIIDNASKFVGNC